MKDKKKIIIISVLAILGILVVALAISLMSTRNNLKESEKQNEEIQELIALEQEEMLNDLQNAQIEYEELKTKILSNDSLLIKLEQEQLRTQQLYEELQNTKATNAAEIKRLKKELKTLRGVLENYMVQIDSLFRENTELKNENSKLIAGKKYRGAMTKLAPVLLREFTEKHSLSKEHIRFINTPYMDEAVRTALNEAAKSMGFEKVTWMKTGCVITCHGGPGAFGIVGMTE